MMNRYFESICNSSAVKEAVASVNSEINAMNRSRNGFEMSFLAR